MFVSLPEPWNGLLVVSDARLPSDANIDFNTRGKRTHVLENWPFQRALPYGSWAKTARIGLFEPRHKPTTEERSRARNALRAWCLENAPRAVVVLQPLSRSARARDRDEGSLDATGSLAWGAFEATGTISETAGCIHETDRWPILGLPHPYNGDHVLTELTRRWLVRAHDMSRVTGSVTQGARHVTRYGPMLQALQELRALHQAGAPLSVDIEAFPDGSVTTAIGLGVGDLAVSVPWDAFRPHRSSRVTPPASRVTRYMVAALLATSAVKCLHNGVDYDIPRLTQMGLPVAGEVHDTYLMHGLAYPQWPHGLQNAVSQELVCHPWKTIYQGRHAHEPRFWMRDPDLGLYAYNCWDVTYTWRLHNALRSKVGM